MALIETTKGTAIAGAPISCDRCPIARHAVYGGLRERLSQMTSLRRAQRSIDAGKLILREGEVVETVYTLFEGWAFKYKMLREGSRQVLAYYIPGDLLVAQAISEMPLPFSVRAATRVSLCAFDAASYFPAMMVAPETRNGLRDYMFACHNETDELLTALGQRSALPRFACLLASLARRMEERGLATDGVFRIPISQNLIADTLGLTHVYVNRIAGQLRREGALEILRNEIRVLDVDALDAYAELT